jgi:hypothetical protein
LFDAATKTQKPFWGITAGLDRIFVFNDTKIGATERAKFHWKQRKITSYSEVVYVADRADKTKPMKQAEFLAALMDPPANQVVLASSLQQKARVASLGKDVSIMYLTERTRGSWCDRKSIVWADAGKADTFDTATTHYYLPLSGYQSLGKVTDVKSLHFYLNKSGVFNKTVYGVRKADIEFILKQKNWVNLDQHVAEKLSKLDTENLMGMVKQAIDFKQVIKYNVSNLINKDSPYNKLKEAFDAVKETDKEQRTGLEFLCRAYGVSTSTVDPVDLIIKYKKEATDIKNRYPLLKELGKYADSAAVAEYINLVDEKKGITK